MKNIIIGLLGVSVSCISAAAQTFNALKWNQNTAYHSYLMRDVHQQFLDRKIDLEKAVTSKKAAQKYLSECIQRYESIIGEFPERGELNARVVGTVKGTGYTIEKIVFQSLPGRYVTANLYLPNNGKKIYPASLELCGHSFHGKGPDSDAAIFMAVNGIAVMVVDPFGQGERLQLIDESGKPLTRGATTEHTLLNAGLNLVGTSLAAQEIWDNSRALDYLMTRNDIDKEHIGVYGCSGGGTQTAYFLGMDKRVKVAAICSFFSTRERTLELQGPSDGCQHIPYEGRERLEVPDFAMMIAPKPLLILSGKYDFVDLWGAQQGFKELKSVYQALGCADRVDMLIVETGHGLWPEKQQRLVRWFKQWLQDDTQSKIIPVPKDKWTLEQTLCTTKGQVNISYSDAVSLMEEELALVDRWQKDRQDFVKKGHRLAEEKVLQLLGLSKLPPKNILAELSGHESLREYEQYKFQLIRDGEMPVPCVVLVPETVISDSPIEIHLCAEGKERFLSEYTNYSAALTDGKIIIAVDFRGLGETADPALYSDAKYWNFEYRNAMTSMHVGRPIMGQRVMDFLTLLDFCSENEMLKEHTIKVYASGVYGPVAIHAAFLDKRISEVSISRSLKSWRSYIENPLQRDMYSNVLYGVLRYYDLPDLIKLTSGSVKYAD